jgi:hypothetical protein
LVILIVLFIFLYKKENANSISDISVMGGQSMLSNDAANNQNMTQGESGVFGGFGNFGNSGQTGVSSPQHMTQGESVGFGGFGNWGNSVHTGDIIATQGEHIDATHMYNQDSIIKMDATQKSIQMEGGIITQGEKIDATNMYSQSSPINMNTRQQSIQMEGGIITPGKSYIMETSIGKTNVLQNDITNDITNNITNIPLMIVSEIKNSLDHCLSPDKKQKIEELMKKIESTQLSQNEIQKIDLESQKYYVGKNMLKNLTLANNQNVIESVREIVRTLELTPQEINCMGTHNSICSANTRDINVTLFGLSKINETLNNYKSVLTELKSNLIKNVKLSLDNCDDPQVKKVIIDKYVHEINTLIRNVSDILSN